MKKMLTLLVLGCGIMMWTLPAYSDETAPPPPPPDHGAKGNQGGAGGAPIDGGLGILLALGAAYGGRKYLQKKNAGKDDSSAKETI